MPLIGADSWAVAVMNRVSRAPRSASGATFAHRRSTHRGGPPNRFASKTGREEVLDQSKSVVESSQTMSPSVRTIKIRLTRSGSTKAALVASAKSKDPPLIHHQISRCTHMEDAEAGDAIRTKYLDAA